MILVNQIAIVGMIISVTAAIIVIYNHCKTNNFYQTRRRRNNRISPEMFHVLARIINERNREQARRYNEERIKEIELTQMKDKYKVIIINPDNNIELGIQKIERIL